MQNFIVDFHYLGISQNSFSNSVCCLDSYKQTTILDTCIMQTMLPQGMVVYEVCWHLTWILSSAEMQGLVFTINSF